MQKLKALANEYRYDRDLFLYGLMTLIYYKNY